MKKVFFVLLIAVLVVSSAFAIEYSGAFRAGYEFTFGDEFEIDDIVRAGGDRAARFKVNATIKDEAWSIYLWTPDYTVKGATTNPIKAYLTLNIDKVASLPEDVKVAFVIGNDNFNIKLPYADPCGSVYSSGIERVTLAGDGIVFGGTVSYKDFALTGYMDPNRAAGKAGIIYATAKFDFISAGAGARVQKDLLDVAGAFTFDIAKVAKLDEKISAQASGYVHMQKAGDADPTLAFLASVDGGYDKISAYAEFYFANKEARRLSAGGEYDFEKLAVGADVNYVFGQDEFKDAFSCDAWAEYPIGGITFHGEIGYGGNVYVDTFFAVNF